MPVISVDENGKLSYKSFEDVWNEHEQWIAENFLIDDDCITIMPETHDYWISWDRIDTKDKLLGWVYHLSCKKWMTTKHLYCFMDLCMKKFGYELRLY